MIRPIYTYGQPVLREKAQLVDASWGDLNALVADMFDTMYQADGVGLAAPQIGLSVRVLVIDASPLANDYLECKDFKRVMINPEITSHSEDAISFEEGCLSFPGVHENVARFSKISVRYLDAELHLQEEELEGFAARVVQHECDHLDGRVFIDSISSIRKQLNKGKLGLILKGAAKCSYRTKPAM